MGDNEYRIKGIIYAILGAEFFFIFVYKSALEMSSRSWIFITPVESIWFFPICLSVLGSLVLMVCGLVLVVRGGVWVARVSGVLFGFLFLMLWGFYDSHFFSLIAFVF